MATYPAPTNHRSSETCDRNVTQTIFLLTVLLSFSLNSDAALDLVACVDSILNSNEPIIACTAYYRQNDVERNQLRAVTHGAIHNLSCQVGINASKADIVRSLLQQRVKLPVLRITCDILFNDGIIKTAAVRFAPELYVEQNRIVSLSLNVKEVSGLGFLDLMVRNHLSSSVDIEHIVNTANDFLSRLTTP